jgi:hypothetical protein
VTYGPFAERLGRLPSPLTDDYAAVVRRGRTTVAERGGQFAGLVVLDHPGLPPQGDPLRPRCVTDEPPA